MQTVKIIRITFEKSGAKIIIRIKSGAFDTPEKLSFFNPVSKLVHPVP